ncbi:MAG: 30S ribosomal protein S12 methylthiotransferase RimO [Coriobacteriia bacterium]|nr:30S ribosomal protein S12 methylthiotransferase RimO [Coriobacteriia bacterium]
MAKSTNLDHMARVAFVTLGCPKNEVDSDRMMASVDASTFALVDDIADADVVVLNTCGFIQDAVEEGVETAMELAAWRDAFPNRKLVIAGCMVSRYGADLEHSLTEADAFVPVSDETGIVSVLAGLVGGDDATPTSSFALLDSADEAVVSRMPVRGPSAYLQISDGCFRTCTYCTIPSIRGPYRSRPLPKLLAEARFLIETGARELVLVGQDTSAWGRDLPGPEVLADVVRSLAGLEGLSWLRIMYLQPDGVTDELLAAMAAETNVCRYLDIPLQHASADVLKAMHRSGSAAQFLGMLERIRAHMPDAVLRTSVIAGFPGETSADVSELIRFIQDAGFDYVGVFPYSPEDGTVAATLPGLLAKRTRIARAQRLRDAADGVGVEAAAARVGSVVEVLSEGVDEEGVPVGRWRGQAPEVDGIVLLDREVDPGCIVSARVVDTLGYDLEAEVL